MSDMDISSTSAIIATIGTIVTAIATIALWKVTGVLTKETRRMADASAQPQIVATLEPNEWSIIHCDLHVTNAGNAAAFDINVEFIPPLLIRGDANKSQPFKKLSLLRPGQKFTSFIGQSEPLLDQQFRVVSSWKRHPDATSRETLSYDFDLRGLKEMGQLGGGNPTVKLAQEVKDLRDDWRGIAQGNKRLAVDIFSNSDRQQEHDLIEERLRRPSD